MNEIIKGMANAAEAIQENFTEQGEKITAVEQNIDLLQYGTVLVLTMVANIRQLIPVTFDKEMNEIPVVVCTGITGVPLEFGIGVRAISTTGFELVVISTRDFENVEFQWLAIGK